MSAHPRDIACFNMESLVAVRTDGAVGIIIAAWNGDGEQIGNIAGADTALAQFPDGLLTRFSLSDFDGATIH